MEELINIADYCNTILVIHGQVIEKCTAVLIKEEDVLEFKIKYRFGKNDASHTYQFFIEHFNFLITETEVLVNRNAIESINLELEKKLCKAA